MTIRQVARTNRESADKFASRISGKTFMNFQVICAPYGGEIEVSVTTDYTNDPQEAQDMLNYLMFCELSK